jgi:salicylate hydroxylase
MGVKPLRVAIAGAGVAGGVIATGLSRLPGVEVIALEQVGPQDHLGAGNGLNIGPNAVASLSAALPEMAARLLAVSLPWRQWRCETVGGEPLFHIPLAEVADCDGIRVRWAELYRICREGADGVVRYRARCEGVDQSGGALSLAVQPVGDAGQPAGARDAIHGVDLVIVADGRYSELRDALCGAPAIRHLGVANYRVLLQDHGATGIDDMMQWFHGPNRLLAFRLRGGLVYLSGNFPIVAGEEITAEQRTGEWLRASYASAPRLLDAPRWLVEAACAAESELHWSRAQENMVANYHAAGGRVMFAGDSAHAMAPTLGQGATMAIEDGAAFLNLFHAALREAGGRASAIDVPALAAAFGALRAERVDFVRQLSWDASDSLCFGVDADAANRAKGGAHYRARLARMYRDIPLPEMVGA